MKGILSKRPSPAMAVAFIAPLVALSATGYAAGLRRNSVGSKQLKRNAVTESKVRNNAVTTNKIKVGAVSTDKIKDRAVTAGKIATGVIPGATSARQVFRDGGQAVAAGDTTIATMGNVAPGAYVILAKTDVFGGGANGTEGTIQCMVDAEGDNDIAQTVLGSDSTSAADSVFEATLNMQVVHTFSATGTVTLKCTKASGGPTSVTAQRSKIIAVKVGSITANDAVGG